MAQQAISKIAVEANLRRVLKSAESLSLLTGDASRVTFEKGVDGWRINDPDNVTFMFMPVSMGLGRTKADAWRTLYNMNEVMFAVKVRHPEIVREVVEGE